MERGYTFVMVDLRGFGGSTGCLDWAGPGETADVVSAVEWTASQPWSNGKVGMYGKSYDGVTGLIGVNQQPEGLAAVVAQEPVYDLYRYLYGDGVRRTNSVLTPALYDGIAVSPGPLLDDPGYNASGADSTQRPACEPSNWADQALNDDHFSDYWRPRNLIPGAEGSEVPLFLTQGLPENNTVPDGLAQYMQNHTGYERAWMGPWDHVRGAETEDDGTLKMGRAGWYDEVDALLRPVPEGRGARGPGPDDRHPDERRQVARRGRVAARRWVGLHIAAESGRLLRRRQRRRMGGERHRRPVDGLARRSPRPRTWQGPGTPSLTSRARRARTSSSTSTTSTRRARDRWSRARRT